MAPPVDATHLVAEVKFTSATEGSVICACGEKTTVAGFGLHRRTVGVGRPHGSRIGAPAGLKEGPQRDDYGRWKMGPK